VAFGARLHLAFADHVHGFNAGDERLRAVKVFETHHRSDDSLDRTVVLLDDGDRLWQIMLPNRAFEKTARCGQVSSGGAQKVNCVTVTVDCPVQIFSSAVDLDVGFVHAPTPPHISLARAKNSSRYGQHFDRPAVSRGDMVTNAYCNKTDLVDRPLKTISATPLTPLHIKWPCSPGVVERSHNVPRQFEIRPSALHRGQHQMMASSGATLASTVAFLHL
jgi:hypothetical protein